MRLPPPQSSTEEDISGSSTASLWDIPSETRNGRQVEHYVVRPTPVRPYTPEPPPNSSAAVVIGDDPPLVQQHYQPVAPSDPSTSAYTAPRTRTSGGSFMPVITINVPSVRTYQELARHRSVNRTPVPRSSPQPQHQGQNVYNIPRRHHGNPRHERATGIPRLVRNPLFNSTLESQLIHEREQLNRSDPFLARFIHPSYQLSSNTAQTPRAEGQTSEPSAVPATSAPRLLRQPSDTPPDHNTTTAGTQTDISLVDDELEFDDYIHINNDKTDGGFIEGLRGKTSDGDDTPTPHQSDVHVHDSKPSTSAAYSDGAVLKARSRSVPQTCYISTSSDTEDESMSRDSSRESTFPVELVVDKTTNLKCTIAFRSNVDTNLRKLLNDKVKLQIVPDPPKTIYKPSNEDKSDSLLPRKVSFSNNLTDVRILEDTEHTRLLNEMESDIFVDELEEDCQGGESVDDDLWRKTEQKYEFQGVRDSVEGQSITGSTGSSDDDDDNALNCGEVSSGSPEFPENCSEESFGNEPALSEEGRSNFNDNNSELEEVEVYSEDF